LIRNFFWYRPTDPYLLEIINTFQYDARNLWHKIRAFVMILLLIWMLISFEFSVAFLVHAITLVFFITLNGVAWFLELHRNLKKWMLYLILAADAILLGIGFFWQPELAPATIPGYGIGLAFFILCATVFLFCASLSLWFGVILSVVWSIGYLSMVMLKGAQWPLLQWLEQTALLLSTSLILSLGVSFFSQRLSRQIEAEREYYEIALEGQAQEQSSLQLSEEDALEFTDRLTGLGTRASFERDSTLFTKVFTEGRLPDLTIAFINIEDFQARFDEYGPKKYSKMIVAFARAARGQFRNSDMVYRLNNYQFALLAPGASLRNTERLESFLNKIIEQVRANGYPEVNATMGLSTLDEAQKDGIV